MPTVLRSVKLQWRVLLSENAHSVRIAGVYPARQVWQGVFLGTIPVVHQAPAVKVCGLCDLDMHVASYRSCCKGIPTVVGADDCGIYMEILTAGQTLVSLPALPGKLAFPIFGPCGARLLRVRLAAYVPAVDGTTGRERVGEAKLSSATQIMDGNMVGMYNKASSRLRTSVDCLTI